MEKQSPPSNRLLFMYVRVNVTSSLSEYNCSFGLYTRVKAELKEKFPLCENCSISRLQQVDSPFLLRVNCYNNNKAKETIDV